MGFFSLLKKATHYLRMYKKSIVTSICNIILVSFLQIFSKSFGIIYFITTKKMASSLRAASTTSVLVAFSFPNRKNSLIGTIQDPTL